MYNLLISLVVGVVVTLVIKLAGFAIWAGLVPGAIAFIATFFFLARRIVTKIQALAEEAKQQMSTPPSNPRDQKKAIDNAVKIFERGLPLNKWQFLVGAELHGQIGMLKYVAKDYDGALISFEKTSPRNYMAKAMEGALFYQRKDSTRMIAAFERAVKSGRKEGMVWAAYAWCLTQMKERDKALKVMSRAVEVNPTDEKLKAGLTALQNDKKLKMKPYEPMWWQFGLEQPPAQMSGQRQIRFQRR